MNRVEFEFDDTAPIPRPDECCCGYSHCNNPRSCTCRRIHVPWCPIHGSKELYERMFPENKPQERKPNDHHHTQTPRRRFL